VDRGDALGEIYALGVRNPQRFGWDPETGAMYLADIGQNTLEEVSPVTAGANLGWNVWEGSYRFMSRSGVDPSNPRSDRAMTYPVAEYTHNDPLIGGRSAATGILVYRSSRIPQLSDRVLFGDFPTGEIFHFDADNPPQGGNQGFRRVLLRDQGEAKTFRQLVQEKNSEQGRDTVPRTDLRIDGGPDGRIFLLNKHDGTIRVLAR
jgi:glucose/arabinose dehydrogenase